MTLESCGVWVPSEVVMTAAGWLALGGHMNLPLAIVAGTLGNLVGSLIAYGLAAKWGEPLLLGPGKWVGITPKHIAHAKKWFDRFGMWSVFIGRDLPVIRTYISFPAGLSKVKLVPFAALTLLGSIPWNAALVLAGYQFGAKYDQVAGPISKAAILIGIAVAVIMVMWYMRGRARTREA
jgi:membrane protein DedA with SNARE-associated domain